MDIFYRIRNLIFDNSNFIILFILATVLTILVYFMCPVASALTVDLHQGDNAYLNETVDLSQAVAWPDYKMVWCIGDNYGCEPPTQTIQITGYMHSYWLDPAIWHLGTYYRWDGHWNRGENSVAFTIKPGTRPIINQSATGQNITNQSYTPNQTVEGPYSYLIARGDDPLIKIRVAREDPGHFWMFGAKKELLNFPMNQSGFDYSYQMQVNDTFSTDVGKYTGYLQFDGKNKLQDVFWNYDEHVLDTPYDDSVIPDVQVNEWNPPAVKAAFENLIKDNKYSDDILVPVTMQVVEPTIIITDLTQGDDKIYLSGRTTWSNGTVLTIKLDDENYKLEQDKRKHTWTTNITGPLTEMRAFQVEVPVTMKEMYLGVHEIKMSVEKNNEVTDMYYDFKVTGTYIMPEPTPEFRKVMTSMNDTPVATGAPTPAPQTVSTPTIPSEITVNGTQPVITVTPRTPAPTPTPKPANVTPTKPTPTYDPNITVPLPWWIALMSIPIVWRFRR
jgi:hypothetical protein